MVARSVVVFLWLLLSPVKDRRVMPRIGSTKASLATFTDSCSGLGESEGIGKPNQASREKVHMPLFL